MDEDSPRISKALFLLILISLFFSCARIKYFPTGNVQTGMASWYGPGFHGKTTSSKEIYNMHDLTAAHKTLPFGTHVVVTNLDNGKSVTVRVNDRGPFIKGRIIDLSYAAAKMVDMIGEGVVPVKIEVIKDISPKKSEQKYSVQVGAFTLKQNALALQKKLQKKYKSVYISVFKTPNQVYYRVRIKARDPDSAQQLARKLTRDGFNVFLIEGQ